MPPIPARLSVSHFCASSFSGGALVSKTTCSSLRPEVWRNRRATWAAKGKQTCSAGPAGSGSSGSSGDSFVMDGAELRRPRFPRGAIRLRGGEQLFDVLAQNWLILLEAQEVIAARFQNNVSSRLGLGVQGVQRNEPVVEVQTCKEPLSDGDFVGLGVHDHAGQIILAKWATS